VPWTARTRLPEVHLLTQKTPSHASSYTPGTPTRAGQAAVYMFGRHREPVELLRITHSGDAVIAFERDGRLETVSAHRVRLVA
jgi:hypothetical protein